jgi:hypothetical protein
MKTTTHVVATLVTSTGQVVDELSFETVDLCSERYDKEKEPCQDTQDDTREIRKFEFLAFKKDRQRFQQQQKSKFRGYKR